MGFFLTICNTLPSLSLLLGEVREVNTGICPRIQHLLKSQAAQLFSSAVEKTEDDLSCTAAFVSAVKANYTNGYKNTVASQKGKTKCNPLSPPKLSRNTQQLYLDSDI
ncbi:testis-specific serine/threonine-protein kinase 6-like [Platysternon megacephalum]|uniref:Testis-specific serine/threonine-protein kinase 6-like n=1 Tax=Platysternon megacephalum TaxID=55544 RepID=A0A4D9F886_9SAUR|nr:testis-specific serine/threonine-protein kinase 6-like [Platysternon megacephalum]